MAVVLMLSFSIGSMIIYDTEVLVCKFNARIVAHEKAELKIIKVPASEFNLGNQADEIWYDGELYDIKSISFSNDFAYITVFHDTAEEQLVNNDAQGLENQWKYNQSSTQRISKHFVAHVDVDKILIGSAVSTPAFCENSQSTSFHYKLPLFTSAVQSVIKPPPIWLI